MVSVLYHLNDEALWFASVSNLQPYIWLCSTGFEPLTLTRPFAPALLRLIFAALALPEGPKGKSAARRPALFETHISLTGSKLASLGNVFLIKCKVPAGFCSTSQYHYSLQH